MNKNITDSYWLGIVDKISEASTCRVKIGTLLVQNRIVVGVGFLGSIPGDLHCDEVGCLLVPSPDQGSDNTGKGCRRTVHSEINAILQCQARGSESSGWIECFTSFAPCLQCFKCLLAIGVRKIRFRSMYKDLDRDKYLDSLDIEIRRNLSLEQSTT